jgi:WhiB family redox-sensing transcriptional regulator
MMSATRALITLVAAPARETDDRSFFADALCAQTDPEVFFPEKGGTTKEAKRICARCEVRDACLAYAVEGDERFGVWGGLSESERRNLKRGGPGTAEADRLAG